MDPTTPTRYGVVLLGSAGTLSLLEARTMRVAPVLAMRREMIGDSSRQDPCGIAHAPLVVSPATEDDEQFFG